MNLRNFVLASGTVMLAVVAASAPASAQKLDAGLFTTYSGGGTSISYVVCGSLPQSSGCYGSGTLSPFEQACAVLEGKAKQKNNVVTRAIYVLDRRTSPSAAITLSVYTRTDTISASSDSIQVSLTKQVSLGLNGGASSHCSMAANNDFVYAATDADTVAAGMNKSTFAVSQLGGFSPPANIVSITADERGYVSLHFNGGFYVYGPDGSLQEDGGGAADMVGTRNAWIPK
jgi:hypothetical protein